MDDGGVTQQGWTMFPSAFNGLGVAGSDTVINLIAPSERTSQIVMGGDGVNSVFTLTAWGPSYASMQLRGATSLNLYKAGTGMAMSLNVQENTAALTIDAVGTYGKGLVVRQKAGATDNIVEYQSAAKDVYGGVTGNGYGFTRQTSAPSDTELVAGQLVWWLDETAGATKAMFKAKDSRGAVRSGSVDLG